MPWRTYLRDRWLWGLLVLLTGGIFVLIVRLDLSRQNASISLANWLYAGLLTTLATAAAVFIDWQRQRDYFRELGLLQASDDRDGVIQLQSAGSGEQRMVQALLHRLYRQYQAQLSGYQQQQETQAIFQNRWVHQMKTPLAVVDLLLQQADQGEIGQQELLASLREERDKLASGLEMMLHHARLGQFTLDFVITPVDLVDSARQVINEQKSSFIRAGVFPQLVAPGQAIVETDGKWFRFALGQLIANAIKYSEPNEQQPRQVILTVRPEVDGFLVQVTDQGVGIPPEDISRIWQAFYTGRNGRRFPQATGMGLYLVKTVLDRLGHRFEVQSEIGTGTTVTIHFLTKTILQSSLSN